MEAFVRQASARVVTGPPVARLGVVNARRPRKAGAAERGARQRRGSFACASVSGVNLERPVVFGNASRIGDSGKAHPTLVARGGAVVAMAAAEADHYTVAAGEFVDSSERSDCVHREWQRREWERRHHEGDHPSRPDRHWRD